MKLDLKDTRTVGFYEALNWAKEYNMGYFEVSAKNS